ncbi:MAG: hypothetical protein OEU26_19205, partial [Candidatus Tectomicrobia bacterium]|nr:hypothetical protein [Candidatus Tectomicrobia bacterium]
LLIGSWLDPAEAGEPQDQIRQTINAGPTTPKHLQETDKEHTEERLNADFSRQSERYRRELQRHGGPDEDPNPLSGRRGRERQALEDITNREGRAPETQNPKKSKSDQWLQRFQLQFAPIE